MDERDQDLNEKQHFQPEVWKKLIPFAMTYKRKLILAAVFVVATAAIDISFPLFQRYAINNFVVPQSTDGILPFGLFYMAVLALQAFLVYLFASYSIQNEMHIGRDIRRKCFINLQKLSLSYYNTTPVGYIIARVMSDSSRISMLIAWSVTDFFWAIFYVLGVFGTMLMLNWRLALLVMTVVPAIAVITLIFERRILKVNRIVRKTNSAITGAFNEGITGAKTSKTLVIEDSNSAEFGAITSRMYRHSLRLARLNSLFVPIVLFCSSVAVALVLARGGYLTTQQLLDFGTFSVFISYALNILEPVQQVASIVAEAIATQINIERVTSLIEHPCDITDSEAVIKLYGDSFEPKTENWEPIRGDIEFRDVTFKYPDGEEYILQNFNLKIPAGTNVAIVGETGAGKSTLVNLACRFFEPTSGTILIDGVDYKERSQLWLHSHLGYVLQNPHLFSGTVAENIRYGRLNATDEEIEHAAKLVSADKVVAKLEQGYNTDVGEGGDRLSTGEKQLISFARAVLADPPIFVLDEATSSIDTETEQLIQNAVAHILGGRTSFLIAHRLSTIRHADLILVVEEGKIIERGTHEQLLALDGHYSSLYKAMQIDRHA